MEIQPILNTIKDLTERSQSIRGIFDYDHKHDRLIEVNREPGRPQRLEQARVRPGPGP